MNITFRKVNIDSPDDLELIAKWSNDPAIKHLVIPNFTGGPLPGITADELRASMAGKTGAHHYMLVAGGAVVGEFSIQVDPPQLHKKEQGSGWIGITIGESAFRGRGLGKAAMRFVEEECVRLGLVRIELGVFEFNDAARKLYKAMGYTEFARLEDFTWLDGERRADIRMEKYL